MGHKIYETKATKPPTKPISHVCQGAQKNYDIKAAKNTDKSHFTWNGEQKFIKIKASKKH